MHIDRCYEEDVKKIASEIMKTGTKMMDACHVACAILAKCDVFLFTDKRLLKYKSEKIDIMNPLVYILGAVNK